MIKRRNILIVLGTIIGLITILSIALVFLFNIDGNRVKPWLNAGIGAALGRPFTIAGNLSLTWEWHNTGTIVADKGWRAIVPWPHFVANDIHIGNPSAMAVDGSANTSLEANASMSRYPDAKAEMATVKQVGFSLDPFALFNHRISVPMLVFDSPMVELLRRADGQNNWTFKNDDKVSAWKLDLQSVILAKGSLHLIDVVKHADVTADIDSISNINAATEHESSAPTYGMNWQLRGRFNDEAVSGSGKAGAVVSLQHQITPYPIVANVNIGKIVIAAEGIITEPPGQANVDMQLRVSGVNMGQLYALSGIYMPESSGFATEGHLVGTLGPLGDHWRYEKFTGKVGSSDIGGSLDYQTKLPRAKVTGFVVSHVLYFSDLAPAIGADSSASQAARGAMTTQMANKILPAESLKAERWTSIDADIQFSAEKVVGNSMLPIKKLTAELHLQNGVLSLLPLNIDIAGGTLNSNISLDGNRKAGKDAIKANAKVTARHLNLKQWFPTLQKMHTSVGEINGEASLSGAGNSVASLLGASNGEIKSRVNQGMISKLLLDEMSLNIGNVVLAGLAGDKQVGLNCIVADFGLENGMMHANTFIIDTEAGKVNVSGYIDLAQEQLNLTIKSESRTLHVLSLGPNIHLGGSFKQPRISVDKEMLAIKAGRAIALAAIAPVTALIPLSDAGREQNGECAKPMNSASVKPSKFPTSKRADQRLIPTK